MLGYTFKPKMFLICVGIASLLAFSFMFFITFIGAYIHPSKTVLININMIGEANFELVLFSILFVISIWTAFEFYKYSSVKKNRWIIKETVGGKKNV